MPCHVLLLLLTAWCPFFPLPVTYLENNRAGITVYGFVVDRAWLHALFMIEFSLVMWLLGKTVGIS
jgi:hypothetical protein